MEKAGQKFLYFRKLSSTKFYLESNWNFLNERGRSEIPISPQTLANEIRFRIKLKLFEWKKHAKSSYILANSPQRNSIQNQIKTFWMKKTGQKFLYLSKLSSTEFHSESNSNFLNRKSRPEILLSSQTSLNEFLFGIKLKISEWKRQAGNSYISASSRQRNSI